VKSNAICSNCKLHIVERNYNNERVGCKCAEGRIEHNYSCSDNKKYPESCIHCQKVNPLYTFCPKCGKLVLSCNTYSATVTEPAPQLTKHCMACPHCGELVEI